MSLLSIFFFVKQKTAYEMRISDWSSDVCSSDLATAMMIPRAELSNAPTTGDRKHELAKETRVRAEVGWQRHAASRIQQVLAGTAMAAIETCRDRKRVV